MFSVYIKSFKVEKNFQCFKAEHLASIHHTVVKTVDLLLCNFKLYFCQIVILGVPL